MFRPRTPISNPLFVLTTFVYQINESFFNFDLPKLIFYSMEIAMSLNHCCFCYMFFSRLFGPSSKCMCVRITVGGIDRPTHSMDSYHFKLIVSNVCLMLLNTITHITELYPHLYVIVLWPFLCSVEPLAFGHRNIHYYLLLGTLLY